MTLFSKISGVLLKISGYADVQCHRVCTSSVHCELERTLLELVEIYAFPAISENLSFKISWGTCPQTPLE